MLIINLLIKAMVEDSRWESSLKTDCEWHRNACDIFVSVIYYLY